MQFFVRVGDKQIVLELSFGGATCMDVLSLCLIIRGNENGGSGGMASIC
jgi:hypothetical protein